MLLLFMACMGRVAGTMEVPGNHALSTVLEIRLACIPIVVEYLSLSSFDHDVSLVNYLTRFPGSRWPHMSPIPANTLYVLWYPLHSFLYGGRTVNFLRRHTDHSYRIHNPSATGQIPAYFFVREKATPELPAVASFFMLPVVGVSGGVPEAVAAERVFLGNFCFKLNTPHVYKHLSRHALELVSPKTALKRKTLGPIVALDVREHSSLPVLSPSPCAHVAELCPKRKVARQTRPQRCMAKHVALKLLSRPKPVNTVGRILNALCFERRDKLAKHGLKLLFALRNRTSLCHIFYQVHRWASSHQRPRALKYVRKRAKQIGLQLPLHRAVLTLPWCGSAARTQHTRTLVQNLVMRLFATGACQSTLFTNGRLKCQIMWKPTDRLIDVLRSAAKFNKNLHDEMFCVA